MAFYFNNLISTSGFQFTGLGNPFMCGSFGNFSMNTTPILFNQNMYNFNSSSLFTNTMNWNSSGFNQWPVYTINPSNYMPSTLSNGSWFNNLSFNFSNLWQNFSSIHPTSSSTTSAVDRKQITVDGIDYSIMGKDASKVKLLRPEMQRKVYAMFKYAQSKGWTMSITSGYRSTKRQAYLYNEWRAGRHNAPVVAKPGTSRHEFGCAVDIRVTCNGRESSEITAEMGRYGSSIGLRWGGNWSHNRETWHFDLDPSKTPSA